MKPPDVFPLGIAGELLAARLTGGANPSDDSHLLGDLEGHLTSYRDHVAGFQSARARGDPYNMLVEGSDAVLNAFFAWVVASRINDAPTRSVAFDRIDGAVGPSSQTSNVPQDLIDAHARMVSGLGREPGQAEVEAIAEAIVGKIPEEPWMDVNVDGVVNIFDAILAAQVVEAFSGTTLQTTTTVF